MKKKVCRRCRRFTDEIICPNCKSNQFTTNWKGRLAVLNAQESGIAKKIGIEQNGEYAIKAI